MVSALSTTERTRRGEAPEAGQPPNLPTTGSDSLRPCQCEWSIDPYGSDRSRPNSTLKTEEIASKGSRRRAMTRGCPRSHPRDAVVGRHLAETQAPTGTAGSTPAPRTEGPEHEWQCSSPARSKVTVRARLGPPQGLARRDLAPERSPLTCSVAIGLRATHRVYRRNLSTAYHKCPMQPYAEERAPHREHAGRSSEVGPESVAVPYAAVGRPWRAPNSGPRSTIRIWPQPSRPCGRRPYAEQSFHPAWNSRPNRSACHRGSTNSAS